MTEYMKTAVLRDPAIIDDRLGKLGLTKEGLINAVRVSCMERNNATGLHPLNAAGTFAYHYGVAALRREYIGKGGWRSDCRDGIETISNDALGIKVGFCNVDEACGRDHPKPCSKKGAGAERASGLNLFDYYGDKLEAYAPKPVDGPALFYLAVDRQGRAELTRPVIVDSTFVAAVERIFLIEKAEESETILPVGSYDIMDDFELQILRK